MTELLDLQFPYSVISVNIYRIKWAHNLSEQSDPTDNGFVINLLETSKRLRTIKKDVVSSVVVVALLFYVHSKHLRSCRDGQLT